MTELYRYDMISWCKFDTNVICENSRGLMRV